MASATRVQLPWAGTFHSIGARLLREYAERIGLDVSFSILDRGDAEDLLAIVRHDLGFSTRKERFPGKAACLAIYSRAINSAAPLGGVLAQAFPAYAHWEPELRRLFGGYVRAKQEQNVLDYSCSRSSRRARASRWWATTRNRSIRFAPRLCATSSSFRRASHRAPA